MTYTNCCIYRVVPPDDKQSPCSKHVEVNYLNKLKVNSASCWFLLYGISVVCEVKCVFMYVCNLVSLFTHVCSMSYFSFSGYVYSSYPCRI
jgi:hypothetical protein